MRLKLYRSMTSISCHGIIRQSCDDAVVTCLLLYGDLKMETKDISSLVARRVKPALLKLHYVQLSRVDLPIYLKIEQYHKQ